MLFLGNKKPPHGATHEGQTTTSEMMPRANVAWATLYAREGSYPRRNSKYCLTNHLALVQTLRTITLDGTPPPISLAVVVLPLTATTRFWHTQVCTGELRQQSVWIACTNILSRSNAVVDACVCHPFYLAYMGFISLLKWSNYLMSSQDLSINSGNFTLLSQIVDSAYAGTSGLNALLQVARDSDPLSRPLTAAQLIALLSPLCADLDAVIVHFDELAAGAVGGAS
jgi:hypothetical protein